MALTHRINAFVTLGEFLAQFTSDTATVNSHLPNAQQFYDGFKHQLKLAQEHNGWFTKANVQYALSGWANLLTQTKLKTWLASYTINEITPKKVAVIMAGNIPMVGFHDMLAVLMTGHKVIVKLSSNDKHLVPFLAKYLEVIEPEFKGRITFPQEQLEGFDAVIATGSNNTARYFEYYFRGKPSIIRKNRNSVAVLTGKESEQDLKQLSNDIFRYYGLGCRSVSKLFVPKNYNFDAFFKAIYHWNPIINETKYANNYDYNKAVYLMSEFDMLENGFLMIKEDQSYASPIATVFYEYYEDSETLKSKLTQDAEHIQCVVAQNFIAPEIPFGQTQNPELSDYADGVDTIAFLLKI